MRLSPITRHKRDLYATVHVWDMNSVLLQMGYDLSFFSGPDVCTWPVNESFVTTYVAFRCQFHGQRVSASHLLHIHLPQEHHEPPAPEHPGR